MKLSKHPKSMEIGNGEIINDDCLNAMKSMPDGSIDAIITDPPYNIARENNFSTMWRSWIDFWEWDKWFNQFSWINEAYRVLTKNSSIVIFNDWKNIWNIARYCEELWFGIKDMIRLEKTNPIPRNRDRRYITDYEVAIWCTKWKWVFNRQSDTYERPKYIASIEKGLHPTQKNLSLMKWLVKIHTNEWQTILDPFMWSGTTWVACQNTNRNFIGIEKDKWYFEIAKKRLEQNKWTE